MCGRYDITPAGAEQFADLFGNLATVKLEPNYNIAPNPSAGTESVMVTRSGATLARWWLIPHFWHQAISQLPTTFNARVETAAEKRVFRSLVQRKRCLVPVTGWREFPGPSGNKRSFRFHHEQQLMAFAGLWDVWRSPDGRDVFSFTVLTCEPSNLVKPLHNRMPVVIHKQYFASWLVCELPLESLPEIATQQPLEVYETSTIGNSTRVEGPECIEPAAQGNFF